MHLAEWKNRLAMLELRMRSLPDYARQRGLDSGYFWCTSASGNAPRAWVLTWDQIYLRKSSIQG
jgi:hypothetical protein